MSTLTCESFRKLSFSLQKRYIRTLVREKGMTKNHPLTLVISRQKELLHLLELEFTYRPFLIDHFLNSSGPLSKEIRCYNDGAKLIYRNQFLWPRFAGRSVKDVDFITLSGPMAWLEEGKVVPIINSEYDQYISMGGVPQNYIGIEMDPTTYDLNYLGYQTLGFPKPVLGKWPGVLPSIRQSLHTGNYIIANFDATVSYNTLRNSILETVKFLNSSATNGWELLVNTSLQHYGCNSPGMVEVYRREMWDQVVNEKWSHSYLVTQTLFESETSLSAGKRMPHRMGGFILKSKGGDRK
jgi:hypothetical protein